MGGTELLLDGDENKDVYRTVLLEKYKAGVRWSLMRRDSYGERHENHFKSMMYHTCQTDPDYDWRNGCGEQRCYGCNSPIPSEIWALWMLHNGVL